MKKKLLTAGIFLALLAGLLGAIFPVLAWKDTAGTPYLSSTQQLYATGDDCIDLVFLGSSHVFCNVDPDCFWQQGGIAAFNMSVAAMDTTSAEYHLRELFKTQSPQVVCLDLYSLLLGREDEAFVYRNYLSMRPSLNSVQAVLDYAPQDGAGDYLLRWPIVHTRYRELQAFDFVQYQPSRFGRGYDYYFIVNAVTQDPAAVATPRVTELSAEGRAWLDAICALCEEHGSALLATITPMVVTEDQQAVLNGAKAYLQQLGIDCLDLNLRAGEIGLDYATDFRDEEHLNAYGAQKVSDYLLRELRARYTLPDRRGDARYALWEENARYAAHRWALETLLQTPEDDPAATLRALAACPDLAVTVSVPAGLAEPGSDLGALLVQLGVPDDALAAGGQWIVQDGRVLAAVPAGSGGRASVDLDAVSTLSIADNAALLVNGVAQVYPLGTFTLAAYDPYEAEIALLRTFL